MKYRSTITIWSDFDPATVELTTLAREANEGDAICTDMEVDYVPEDQVDEAAVSFFGVLDA